MPDPPALGSVWRDRDRRMAGRSGVVSDVVRVGQRTYVMLRSRGREVRSRLDRFYAAWEPHTGK
jgi:hypothetical protein